MSIFNLSRRDFCFAAAGAAMLTRASAALSQAGFWPGVIYGIAPNGDLFWYRHDGRGDGSNRWANGGTRLPVGNGWDIYRQVFSAGDGTIYGIAPNGDLFWYRHDGRGDGSNRWANGGTRLPVGNGWDMYHRVLAG